jgi:type IV secretory system conjugative DNA transfer VirD4/TraG family protein
MFYAGAELGEDCKPLAVHLPVSVLSHHGIVTGPPGSGKTSRVVLPLCEQILALPEGHPLIVIDLKGDSLLFQGVREAALRHGRSFRWVTLSPTHPSYLFNFFSDDFFAAFNTQQVVEILLEAISLHYGEDYGRGFYTATSREVLWTALRQSARPRSFAELAKAVTNLLVERVEIAGHIPIALRDALHLAIALNWLADVAVFNVDHPSATDVDREQAVTMSAVLEHREVVYFWLPRMSSSISAPSLAKAAIYAAVVAGLARQNQGLPRRQAFAFVDEAQHIASPEIKAVLEQARSLGLGTVLSLQSLEALNKEGFEMWPFVRDCTTFQLFLGCSGGLLADYLARDVGGTYTHLRRGMNEQHGISGPELSISLSEEERPRFDANTFARLNSIPGLALMYIKNAPEEPHFSPLPEYIQTFHSMSRSAAQELERRPWPVIPGGAGVYQHDLPRPTPLADTPPAVELQDMVIQQQRRTRRKKS